MELCHCLHRQNKIRCEKQDFCERIEELEKENARLKISKANLLKDYLGACVEAGKYSSRYDTVTLKIRDQQATITELREALEVLAKLGNGEHYGNSDGNCIAKAPLKQEKD